MGTSEYYCTVMLQVWPKLASFFDLPVGEPQKLSMVTVMADYVSPFPDALVGNHEGNPSP